MDLSQLNSLYLRSTSAVSLDKRFSQVLMDQLTWSRTCDLVPLHQRTTSSSTKLVRLVKKAPPSLVTLQESVGAELAPAREMPQVRDASLKMTGCLRKRSSVWTRIGWQQGICRPSTRRPLGFWSFRNKYRWRVRSSWRKRRRPGQRHFLRTTELRTQETQNFTAGRRQLGLQRDTTRTRRRRFNRANVPTRKELDAQLDRYMSLSRSRLDAELDQYMLMAGQSNVD
ncbi:uncharacterized protein LOC121641561 isoform X1 [Melanotaenia boesemani]|uniref:uncharacterized protein LOC121641561 isoform X1 n=1 Tax=Melanotaenia boesemani TaxID=1250792 RepID=UPI001C04A9CD|nr:uncharacterized protein LOC121641561 isoform X1 [Melanotaenia boesemani]XP_041843722.1 uncharacterized protein LOC121641561 isoform X1 [Melanotaenia boesemani]